jgi:hypothetical protein
MTTLALLAGCVPASDELPPAGAAGFAVEPSPPARGEPFMTADGWSIRFERVLVLAAVFAEPASPRLGGSGNQESYLWNGAAPAVIFARALPVGPCRVRAWPQSRYLPAGGSDGPFSDPGEILAVPPELAARFGHVADNGFDHGVIVNEHGGGFQEERDRWGFGPSIVFAVRAERGGRVVALDLALNAVPAGFVGPAEPESVTVLDVQKNALVLGPLTVEPERIFAEGFEQVADADADGDGRITADELRAVELECEECPTGPLPPGVDVKRTLLGRLAERASEVLVSQ